MCGNEDARRCPSSRTKTIAACSRPRQRPACAWPARRRAGRRTAREAKRGSHSTRRARATARRLAEQWERGDGFDPSAETGLEQRQEMAEELFAVSARTDPRRSPARRSTRRPLLPPRAAGHRRAGRPAARRTRRLPAAGCRAAPPRLPRPTTRPDLRTTSRLPRRARALGQPRRPRRDRASASPRWCTGRAGRRRPPPAPWSAHLRDGRAHRPQPLRTVAPPDRGVRCAPPGAADRWAGRAGLRAGRPAPDPAERRRNGAPRARAMQIAPSQLILYQKDETSKRSPHAAPGRDPPYWKQG